MQQTEVDAVPTFWEQGPEPFSATLMFFAGDRHETFRSRGVAHLVEHLVMSTLPRDHLDKNASVDVDTMRFYATGPRDEVVAFLHGVCRALTSLPLDRLERELKVLAAEDGRSCEPHLGWAMFVRSGPVGPGLLGELQREGRAPTATHVTEFARTFCVASNAVLVLSGPVPDELRLNLPSGTRASDISWRPSPFETPALMAGGTPVVALSYLSPRATESQLVDLVLLRRIEEKVRHDLGLAYEVSMDGCFVDTEQGLVSLATDGAEEDSDEIVHALWAELTDLAAHGPTQEELAHEKAGFAAYLEDPRTVMSVLEGAALRYWRLGAAPSREELRERFEAVTVEQVRDWARAARGSAVIGVPELPKDPLPDVVDRTEWEFPSREPIAGQVHKRRLTAIVPPRDLAVHAGHEGITVTAAGTTIGGEWADVVGVGRTDGFRFLHFADGASGPLWAKHVRDGDRLLALIDEHTSHVSWETTEEAALELD
ncbi:MULTISPECIES: M16 family metallopeptidase [unclassified Knoellia]|uniref:M16 family metallopeptidase n=1 Tax=Knoellia altitudinis TaxID=3404795 RepID=UPI003618AB06